MRIAFVTHSFPISSDHDPLFPATWELANALCKLGHELLVLTLCHEKDERDDNIEVNVNGIRVLCKRLDRQKYNLFEKHGRLPIFGWQIARARELYVAFNDAISEFKPEILECHEFFAPGFFWAAQKDFPLVVRCYGAMSLLMRKGVAGSYHEIDHMWL